MKLTKQDKELIEAAVKVANKNPNREVLVGCALKAKSGKIYKGVNLKSSHSVCAEQVAIGSAFACGECEFETIVAVTLNEKGEPRVVSPCGLCRYVFDTYNFNFNVIVRDIKTGELIKVKAKELLPYPYERNTPKKLIKLKKG